jgi:hypothetical protein
MMLVPVLASTTLALVLLTAFVCGRLAGMWWILLRGLFGNGAN